MTPPPRGGFTTLLAADLDRTLSIVRDQAVAGTVAARIDPAGSASEAAGAAAQPGVTLVRVFLAASADVRKGDAFSDGGILYVVQYVQALSDLGGANALKVAYCRAQVD